jgi:hypothetical protein
VGLERGPLILVRITEELLEWKSSGSGSRKSNRTDGSRRVPEPDCTVDGGPPTSLICRSPALLPKTVMVNVDPPQILLRCLPPYSFCKLLECLNVPMAGHGTPTFQKVKESDTLVIPKKQSRSRKSSPEIYRDHSSS